MQVMEDFVKQVQRLLNLLGTTPKLEVDGKAGTLTNGALDAQIKKLSPVASEPVGDSLEGLAEGTEPWYRVAYRIMTFDPGFDGQISYAAKLVLKGKARYEAVAKMIGWSPAYWWVIGIVHYKEASCSFAGILHNGEKIIGTGKKTTLVPKGRGPFSTWEEAAVDALKIEALGKLTNFEVGALLYAVERYNGTGYISGAGKADTSPYLWGMTSINDGTGLYVRDGKYDPNYTSNGSAGFCAIMKWLELAGEIEVSGSDAGEPEMPQDDSKKERFLAYVESFVGVLYQWGGDFARWKAGKDFGLDCSGFEQALAAWQGIDQPGDQTADMIMRYYLANGGKKITQGQEDVGDRVFYGSGGKATHVVCVVGPGRIVGANGGGSRTTTAAIARQQGASIKYANIGYRRDIICIVRPAGQVW